MKKEIILPIGNIGSGKSTLAKQYAKKGYIVISRDSFRTMIGGNNYIFDLKIEPFIKKATIKTLETFLKGGYNIFYDETNVTKRLRSSTIKLGKKYGYKINAIILKKLSKEESVNRRMNNPHGKFSKKTWEFIWEKFDFIYEEPSKKEGIDKIGRME